MVVRRKPSGAARRWIEFDMAHLLRFRGSNSTTSVRRLRARVGQAALETLDARARRDRARTARVGRVAVRADLERLAGAGRTRLDHGAAGRTGEGRKGQLWLDGRVHRCVLSCCVLK